VVADVRDHDGEAAAVGQREEVVEIPRDLQRGLEECGYLPAGRLRQTGGQEPGLDGAADFELALGHPARLFGFDPGARRLERVERQQPGPGEGDRDERADDRDHQTAEHQCRAGCGNTGRRKPEGADSVYDRRTVEGQDGHQRQQQHLAPEHPASGRVADEVAGQDRVDAVGVHPAQRVELVDRDLPHVGRSRRDVRDERNPARELVLPELGQLRVVRPEVHVGKIIVAHRAPRSGELDAHAPALVHGDADVAAGGFARSPGARQDDGARLQPDPPGRHA
jgi:hypothetical protein